MGSILVLQGVVDLSLEEAFDLVLEEEESSVEILSLVTINNDSISFITGEVGSEGKESVLQVPEEGKIVGASDQELGSIGIGPVKSCEVVGNDIEHLTLEIFSGTSGLLALVDGSAAYGSRS